MSRITIYTSTDSQDLIISRRVLNGERELFELLVRAHSSDLYDALKTIVHTEELADRTMLTTYACAFRALYGFYGQVRFKVWLISIGLQQACEAVKIQNGVNEHALHSSTNSIYGNCIRALPELPEIIFVLKTIAKLSNKEISFCVHVSQNDIKSFLRTAIARHKAKRVDGDEISKARIETLRNGFMKDLMSGSLEEVSMQRVRGVEDPDTHSGLENADPVLILKEEHRENLTLCTNIRIGFTRGIELNRIKKYANWYWENHLLKHFVSEERLIFPILGKEHALIKRAMADHRRLKRLFRSKEDIHKMLNRIEEELEAHVRFEEKVLFKEIEHSGSKKDLNVIELIHQHDAGMTSKWGDEFWKG